MLKNGRIVTMDASNPIVEGVAARGQELVAVGTNADVERLIGPDTEVIDLGGALAVPGLIEGHGHGAAGRLGLGPGRRRSLFGPVLFDVGPGCSRLDGGAGVDLALQKRDVGIR